MKTFTICIIIAFFSLIATIFIMDTRAILMDPFTIGLIIAICSVLTTIFIIETHFISINSGVIIIKTLSVSLNTGAITMKTLSFNIKDISLLIILALFGTTIAIFVLNGFFTISRLK
jgi:hypothetical protein